MSCLSFRRTNKTILVCATDTRDCYEFSYCTVWEGIQMLEDSHGSRVQYCTMPVNCKHITNA